MSSGERSKLDLWVVVVGVVDNYVVVVGGVGGCCVGVGVGFGVGVDLVRT